MDDGEDNIFEPDLLTGVSRDRKILREGIIYNKIFDILIQISLISKKLLRVNFHYLCNK